MIFYFFVPHNNDIDCSTLSLLEKQCPSLELPSFIRERPESCHSDPSFEDSCHLSCRDPGYRIDPPTSDFIRCRGDGQWSQDTTDVGCTGKPACRFLKYNKLHDFNDVQFIRSSQIYDGNR